MHLDNETKNLAKDLINFMQSKFNFGCMPRIKFIFDKNNSKKILGMTGGYDQENEEISIYALNRHPKDILRSLAHEMMHHIQKCEGMMEGKDMSVTADPNYIMHDDFLKKIEADAFERGNICFREWEAGKKGDKTMSESKKMTDTQVKKAHKLGKKLKGKEGIDNPYALATSMAKKGIAQEAKKKKEIPLDKADVKNADAADRDDSGGLSQWELTVAKKIEASQEDKKEVKVNEALKNAHNYNTITRALPETAAARDEFVYEELLRKFGIKK